MKRLAIAITAVVVAALWPKVSDARDDHISDVVAALLEEAIAGDVSAQFRLASAYDTGTGVPRDGKEAMRWYLAAANQGCADAQNSVGSGLQADKKYSEAKVWYEKAASQGHALATNNLAYLYDLGLGVGQDRLRAFSMYSQAADLGWSEAMWNVANMYGAGQLGEAPNLVQACIWAMRAGRFAEPASQLQAYVSRFVPMFEQKLSSEEMLLCREQGASWSPHRQLNRDLRPCVVGQ